MGMSLTTLHLVPQAAMQDGTTLDSLKRKLLPEMLASLSGHLHDAADAIGLECWAPRPGHGCGPEQDCGT